MKSVVQISNGVAVVADNTWAAMQGRLALEIQWDEGPLANLSARAASAVILPTRAQQPGAVARQRRRCRRRAGQAPPRIIEAVYEVPYLAHAPMEPLNCTADVRAG